MREKQKDKKKGKEGKEKVSKEKQREKEERNKDKKKNVQKKDRKDKKGKKKQSSDTEQQKERDKQFKRLARLANYDEEIIDPNIRNKRIIDREKTGRKLQENGDRRDRRRNIDERDFDKDQRRHNDFEHHDFDDDRFVADRGFDRELFPDRGFDRHYGGGYEREDRFDTIDKRRGGKRGKGYLEIDRLDPSIRVERNFARMDIYEEKFERDRARNLEFVRRRPEFEDYYEGRSDDSRMRGQDRDGRRREVEDPSFDARQYRDRTVKDDRRRNRSEERIPREGGRRK